MMLKKATLTLLGLILLPLPLLGADTMSPVHYTLNFNAQNALCVASVNQVIIIENYYDEGPLAAGFNVAPYLENGPNILSIDVASLTALKGDPTYSADFNCRVKLKKETQGHPEEVTQLVASVVNIENKLRPTATLSPNYQGTTYIGAVKEFQKKNDILYHIEREVTITGLPEWAWTKAATFENSPENMKKLQQAYEELWQMMNNKDTAGILKKAKISFDEKEAANGLAAGMWADSLEFDKKFEQSTGAVPINWSDFNLEIIMDGRLVRLDNRGFSPLRLKNQEGKGFWGYNPWFSLIDGKLVITR